MNDNRQNVTVDKLTSKGRKLHIMLEVSDND